MGEFSLPIEAELIAPYLRGHWTDEEMLIATGASSVSLVRAMQAAGFVKAHQQKNEHGRIARAWRFDDLIRIALAIDFAETTGFGIDTAVAILGSLVSDEIEAALSVRQSVQMAEGYFRQHANAYGPQALVSILPQPAILWRSERVRLFIVDREVAFVRTLVSPETTTEQFVLGRLENKGKGRKSRLLPVGTLDLEAWNEDGFKGANSVLEVIPARLAMAPFRIGNWQFVEFDFSDGS